ncbi:hypothetical protein SUGI_0431640 [Cryptomeria japonica]|uniref:uncharacterized protein LOC131047708 n=1 Tax=Cryptomeria japonica TaxID=3369 RepID=UPI002408CCDB|nr:uncharacterized protein LOC131047708 [Cryptomeria japonica]GLJ22894.1 hypothetical protein SUGI_0431640 [Cryptomeria japonica]
MHFFFIYPGFPVGPAAGYGGFFGADLYSQWRVLPTTVLPDGDPSLNSKILNAYSRGSSRRMPCPSSRRLPVALKTLKIGENEQLKHGNKAESPRSPCFDYLPFYDRVIGADDDNERKIGADDDNFHLLTANSSAGSNGLWDPRSFVVGKEENPVF